MTLLEVRDLKKHFPIDRKKKVYAVDGVSFTIEPGETLGLVGESGCGKSTLGRTILRLHEATSGEVIFDGCNLTGLNAKEMRAMRRKMQMVFQDPFSSLNPRMTVGNIVAEPFRIHEDLGKQELTTRVEELLDLVGLGADSANKHPHEFSGGQRQRIGIARAIALRPKLIVADEPVSALDVSIQSQILNLLTDLREKFQLAYLFIAHDLAVIEHICENVAVMYLGKIVEKTGAAELYANPMHPYTKALIEAIPKPEYNPDRKKRQPLTGDVPSPIHPPSGCHFHPRCPLATEKCRQEVPKLKNRGSVAAPHWVSCHHV